MKYLLTRKVFRIFCAGVAVRWSDVGSADDESAAGELRDGLKLLKTT